MKRKIEFTARKTQKMMKTDQLIANSSIGSDESRNFNYKLTDKKAKANLRNAAMRKPFEIEMKQRSCNLRFSAGAFLQTVKPRLEIWKQFGKNMVSYKKMTPPLFFLR